MVNSANNPTKSVQNLPQDTLNQASFILSPLDKVKANPNTKPDSTDGARTSALYAKSTLERSHRDPKFTPAYEPIRIMFLTGAYAKQFLDLGTNTMTLSESQSAQWETTKGSSVRTSSSFKNIEPRRFNLDLDYWDNNKDIRQLVENCAHLQEITDFSHSPPDLQIINGTATIDPVVCTSFEPTYDTPLPGNRGWHHGTVKLTFELRSEKSGRHELAPPLGPTPLGDYKKKTNAADRAKMAAFAQVEALLEPCLGKEAVQKLETMMRLNQLNNPDNLLKLDSETFLQLAAAGFPNNIMSDPRIQQKIKTDTAVVMAKRENGMNPIYMRDVAQALLLGDTKRVPEVYLQSTNVVAEKVTTDKDGNFVSSTNSTTSKSLFEMMKNDYDVIVNSILNGKLSSSDDVFNRDKNPTAGQRIQGMVSCGLGMRNQGAPLFAGQTNTDAAQINGINQLLSNPKTTDAELKRILGLPASTPETVLRKLRSGVPYDNKEDFLKSATTNRQGFSAYNMLSSFSSAEAATLGKMNEFLQQKDLTDDQIKEAFGLTSPQDIKKIRDAKAFKDKDQFLAAFGSAGTNNLTGPGSQIWVKFQLNESKLKDKGDAPH
jgi:hypothetical protein